MRIGGVIGALIGGAIGAAVWALLAWKLHIEIGYIAWGVGLAVGFLSAMLGGRGIPNGVLCAIVALLAIFAGKMAAVKLVLPEALKQGIAKDETIEDKALASQFAELYAEQISLSQLAEAAVQNLGPIDLLFAFLGVATAFKIGAQTEDDVVDEDTDADPSSEAPAPQPTADGP